MGGEGQAGVSTRVYVRIEITTAANKPDTKAHI